ncbi:MAG: SufD family Fe-S cluster assembly protein [Bifidobacteriaceae bacterium]|jgi:Fe-S cluster assembly protein SufD|nr:SufD family Fe-S cluster assembly protein [Bifidobacteriaceae bacterium]
MTTFHQHGDGPAASRALRLASFDPAAFDRPSGREEEWRFTPVTQLGSLFEPSDLVPDAAVTVEQAGGATCALVPKDHPSVGTTPAPGDRVAAAAWQAAEQAFLVTFDGAGQAGPAGEVGEADRTGVTWLTARGGAAGQEAAPSAGLIVIEAKPGARGTVVIDHVGQAYRAGTMEIVLGEGADLTVVTLHQWAPDAVHVTSHRARLAKDAHLKHVTISTGGALVRVTPHVALEGPGANLELLGLNLTDTGQHHEAQLFVDHAAPNCTSRATYKGALLGEGAHSVWIGDVLIRGAAHGTDTYELNRNLVLAKGAHADSVPNLEIETGNIRGAGHASATGRFDDEQLFYLQARGIPEVEARSLVVHAFFNDLIGRIGRPEIEARLTGLVDQKLAAVMARLGLSLGPGGGAA